MSGTMRSYVRDGKHPCTILNECVWHNGTRLCLSGGCYTKACPEPCHIANTVFSLGNSNLSVHL